MTLRLDNGYEIRSYEFGWMIGKNVIAKSGKNAGEGKFNATGYHTTLHSAAQALLKALINADDTIYVNDVKALISRVNAHEQNLNKQLGLED